MGLLKAPALLAGVTVDPADVIGRPGDIVFDAARSRFIGLDGETPGGLQFGDPETTDFRGFADATDVSVADRLRHLLPNVRLGGAVGDGTTNDTAAFLKMKDSNAPGFVIPPGNYLIDGALFDPTDTIKHIHWEPGAIVTVNNLAGAVGFDIRKQVFSMSGLADVRSKGDKADGRTVVGIRHGTPTVGQAYLQIERLRVEGFSSRGFLSFAPVNVRIDRVDGYACGYAVDFATIPSGGTTIGATMVSLGTLYLTGCLRGLNMEAAAWAEMKQLTLEHSGGATGFDGALHLNRCARLVVYNRYGELNGRNMVLIDSTPTFIGGGFFSATNPDYIEYNGVGFDDRGATEIGDNAVRAAFFGPDRITGRDGRVGKDIVLPLNGGRTRFGKTTTQSYSGQAVSGVWTMVAPALGQSGDGQARRAYDYVVRMGAADKTTGIDRGTIMNGQLYSASGTTPTWLRLTGDNNLEVNVTQTDYGLTYSVDMTIRNGSDFS